MTEEMLKRGVLTGRREPWQARLTFKKYLDVADTTPKTLRQTGNRIASLLVKQPLFEDDTVIEGLRAVDTVEEFNELLDALYDECDRTRIWVQ